MGSEMCIRDSKADKDLGGNKIKLKLAWYGIEEPEDLRIKVDGYSVINAV